MKDVEMIVDLILDKVKNDNEINKLKENIYKLENRNNYLENELKFARDMVIKKHNENKELTKTIEELEKDKLKENNSYSKLIESYRMERKSIFHAWKDDLITAKSIINGFVELIYVNVLFHDKILKMISSEMGEISIEILKEYIEKGKKFISKDSLCCEDTINEVV